MEAFELFMATVNGQDSGADIPIAVAGPTGELMLTLTGALWQVFDQGEREGRVVTARLATMLDDHPDIEARLSLRTAQALARSLLGDLGLAEVVMAEIPSGAVSWLLLLVFRELGYSDEAMRTIVVEMASALQAILAASGGSTRVEDIIRASDVYFGRENQAGR